jgi:molybdenum cofactor biosynthesis enzyme MoaA
MPAITDLWLSGGEPTLRHDATEIIETFVRNNGVARVIIPTNGLVKARVCEIVDHALSHHSSHPSLFEYRARWLRKDT